MPVAAGGVMASPIRTQGGQACGRGGSRIPVKSPPRPGQRGGDDNEGETLSDGEVAATRLSGLSLTGTQVTSTSKRASVPRHSPRGRPSKLPSPRRGSPSQKIPPSPARESRGSRQGGGTMASVVSPPRAASIDKRQPRMSPTRIALPEPTPPHSSSQRGSRGVAVADARRLSSSARSSAKHDSKSPRESRKSLAANAAPRSAPVRRSDGKPSGLPRRASAQPGGATAASAIKIKVYPLRSGSDAGQAGEDIKVGLDTSECQYTVVTRARDRLGWVGTSGATDSATVIVWRDDCLKPTELNAMRTSGVRWNHLPGIESICTKCGLQQTIGRVAAAFPKHFKFFPRSWSLPVQWIKLEHYMKTKGIKNDVTLIIKPNTLSRGRGIYLTQDVPPRTADNVMVQHYIERPLLIGGLKFDLRMYVLITDARCGHDGGLPRVFLHHEGLARFCTTPYAEPAADNLADNTRHLSNYSVNKWSAEYVKSGAVQEDLRAMAAASEASGGLIPPGGEYLFGDGGKGLDEPEMHARCRASQDGSKWTLTAFANWATDNGHDVGVIWQRCCDLAAKTALAASVSTMHTQYTDAFGDAPSEEGLRCFELLGVDVLLDEGLRPHLLEVNMSPSAGTDTALDLLVKEPLHQEALQLAAAPPAPPDVDRQQWRDAYETRVCRGFHRVLPPLLQKPGSKRMAAYAEIAGYTRHGSK